MKDFIEHLSDNLKKELATLVKYEITSSRYIKYINKYKWLRKIAATYYVNKTIRKFKRYLQNN